MCGYLDAIKSKKSNLKKNGAMPKKKKVDDFAKKWVICKNNIPSEIYSSLNWACLPQKICCCFQFPAD